MDLSFTSFDKATELVTLPGDLPGNWAVLMVGVAQRQATSATAAAQAHWQERWSAAADPLLFRPLHGAFNGPMAAICLHWRKA